MRRMLKGFREKKGRMHEEGSEGNAGRGEGEVTRRRMQEQDHGELARGRRQ